MRELSEAELVREAVTGEVIDSDYSWTDVNVEVIDGHEIKARATVMVTIEYDVEQTFKDDMTIHDMRDNWDQWIELPEGCMPKEWDYVEVDISKIEIDATKEEWYP